MTRTRVDGRIRDRAAVNQEEIEQAVVVVVQQHATRPHRLGEVLLRTCSVGVGEGDAGGGRDVLERDRPWRDGWARLQPAERRAGPRRDISPPRLPLLTALERLVDPDLILLEAAPLVLHRLLLELFEHLEDSRTGIFGQPETHQGATQRVARLEMRGIQRDRSAQQRDGRLVAAGRRVDLRRGDQCPDVGRVQQRRDRVLGERLVETILRAIEASPIDMCSDIVRRKIDSREYAPAAPARSS